MDQTIRLKTPLTAEDLESLRIGDRVLLNGIIYTARDAAHGRLIERISRNESLPIALEGQVIYYVGPTPAKPGEVIGAAGPTSGYRMDPHTPALLEKGLKGMIGKGPRDSAVKDAMQKHKAVYFAAIGGAGALIAQSIRSAEIVAYPDLETEAIRRLEIQDFPAIVAIDIYGGDLYETGQNLFAV